MTDEIVPGKYRHYKGNDYQVYEVARHSETQEPLVVYRALYGNFDLWVRPLAMFSESVDVNGEEILRFSLIEKADVKDTDTHLP
ncbi:DUF1653 domain-containing protein [Agarilytica rhodophyticola]|uniref:DUF1653 domain-containing protein n=1 Tax=Agarilytica rhodophyticola TaxID=1737490 RepID=UPI000B3437F9|nr:DUF1653 domain-containing protein [Agarilytica rhodophyticola]